MVLNTLWHYTLRLFDKIAIFEQVGKSTPKGTPKVIVDAERHRRTPGELVEGGTRVKAGIGLEAAETMRKRCENDTNIDA